MLPDQKEYILIGTLHKEDRKISVIKDFTSKEDFSLIDPKSYDIIYNTSKAYRIGCTIFLILLFSVFIALLTQDLWIYLIEKYF